MSNISDSIIFYQTLIRDAEKEIEYWNSQPEGEAKRANLDRFNQIIAAHKLNIKRLEQQITKTTLMNEVKKYLKQAKQWLNWFERIKKLLPGLISPELEAVAAWFKKAVEIAEGLLKKLKLKGA